MLLDRRKANRPLVGGCDCVSAFVFICLNYSCVLLLVPPDSFLLFEPYTRSGSLRTRPSTSTASGVPHGRARAATASCSCATSSRYVGVVVVSYLLLTTCIGAVGSFRLAMILCACVLSVSVSPFEFVFAIGPSFSSILSDTSV